MRRFLILILIFLTTVVPAFAEIIENRSGATTSPAKVKRALVARPAAPPAAKQNISKGARTYKNGAGPTGNNWSSGVENGKAGSTGARRGQFTNDGAGLCGPGQDLWAAAGAVMTGKVIPQNKGYDLLAPAWPRIAGSVNSVRCHYGAGKVSMCTSATAAAFCQHFADLSSSGSVALTPAQTNFLNGPQVKAAINGNTYSLAYLFQHLGGTSIIGKSSNIFAVLSQAKTGDVLRFDRNNGTGHSTIFQKVEPTFNQFCYWSSNTLTEGTGVQCESISSLTEVVVSRFPADLDGLPAKIDKMAGPWGMGSFNARRANHLKESEVHWASNLECPDETDVSQ